MILIEVTIKYKGYSPLDLSKGSHKQVCVVCDKCGRVRWIEFRAYRNICQKCSYLLQINKKHPRIGTQHSKDTKHQMGDVQKIRLSNKENHPMYGKHHSEESKYKSGQSLIKHHYIYDHSDLSKYTMLVTRKQHGKIHSLFRKIGIKILHINR